MSRIEWLAAALVLASLVAVPSLAGTIQLQIDENDVAPNGLGRFSWNEPLNPGSPIWFDVLIANGLGQNSEGVQITLSVQAQGHAGSLTFSSAMSQAVAGDSDYWLFGNSAGANAMNLGGNVYQFGDGPNNPASAPLLNGRSVARFAFAWDGTVGDYRVSVDTSTQNTFVLQNFVTEQPGWIANPVTLAVPEPSGFGALALFGIAIGRWRRQA